MQDVAIPDHKWGTYSKSLKEELQKDKNKYKGYKAEPANYGDCDMWDEADNKCDAGRDGSVGINYGCIHFKEKQNEKDKTKS